MDTGAEFMKIPAVARYCGVSKTTIREWSKRPDFPKAIRPTKRTVMYRRSDIDAWLDRTKR